MKRGRECERCGKGLGLWKKSSWESLRWGCEQRIFKDKDAKDSVLHGLEYYKVNTILYLQPSVKTAACRALCHWYFKRNLASSSNKNCVLIRVLQEADTQMEKIPMKEKGEREQE